MKLGKTIGTVVSTVNHPFFDRQRLLLCSLIGPDGTASGYVIAADVVGAGAGETVLILDEGTSARQIFDITTGPIRAVVVGIVDEVHLAS